MDVELPHARPKERELLAGLIVWPAGMELLNGLEPKHFTSPTNRKQFAEMKKRRAKGHSWDGSDFTVTDDYGDPVEAGNSALLPQIAEEIQETHTRRRAVQLATKLVKDVRDPEKDPLQAVHSAESRLSELKQVAAIQEPFEVISAKEIISTDWPEPIWSIPELLPVGLAILAAKAKFGKSWMALQIAQAIGTGGEVFGKRVERRKVLLLALEDPERRLQWRMETQGWSPDADVDFMVFRKFREQVGDLKNGGGDRLAARIEAEKYGLVFIDTLSKSVFGDQNDVEQMTRALAPIQMTAQDQNCTILMIDHHGKGGTGDVLLDILGSTAKGAVSDTGWGLYRERGQSEAKLAITGRDVFEQTLRLRWDRPHGKWLHEGDAIELEMTESRQEIVETLRELGPLSATQLADVLGKSRPNLSRRLNDLHESGLLDRQRKGNAVEFSLRGNHGPAN